MQDSSLFHNAVHKPNSYDTFFVFSLRVSRVVLAGHVIEGAWILLRADYL